MDTDAMTDYYWENLKDILQRQLADDDEYHALIQKKITAENALKALISEEASLRSSIISVKSVWKRCHMDLPGSTNLIQRKASRTSRLRPIIMWTRLFFKLLLQHGGIYGIAVPRFASWYPPSIWKAI